MGKKSREKKERREAVNASGKEVDENVASLPTEGKPFLVKVIFWAAALAVCVSPFIVLKSCYFPFVGPRSLFFMGLAEIAFFSWLGLIIRYKKYRPRINTILISFALFIAVLTLSTVLGVDPSRSFWSKFERMTGLLMWLHLFGFFLAVSSTFKRVLDWKKIFAISIFSGIVLALLSLLEEAGIEAFKFSGRGGSAFGNTSFLGTYLLFNFFLAVWLAANPFEKRKGMFLKPAAQRICFIISAFLMLLAIYFAQARAATVAVLGGMVFLLLAWLSFRLKNRKQRCFAKIFFYSYILIALAVIILLFIPGSLVRQKFGQIGGEARFVNWKMAEQAFFEKPVLGWGPENYTLAFTVFYNPCLGTGQCGDERWFDRAHNIVFDTLATTGALGLAVYALIFLSYFLCFLKAYFRKKTISFWTAFVFPTAFAAYFVQNLSVFDMMTSLLMFVLLLSFASFLSDIQKAPNNVPEAIKKKKNSFLLAYFFIWLLFIFSFFNFVVNPWKTDTAVIKALINQSPEKRISFYKTALSSSPLGKHQIRQFFSEQLRENIRRTGLENIFQDKNMMENAKKELAFIARELEKSLQESPLDYRSALDLANLYNIYYLFDRSKLALAEKYGELCLQLSPKNQQGYWALAQAKMLKKEKKEGFELLQKAINLEPRWLTPYKFAVQMAWAVGEKEKAKDFARQAGKIQPEWQKKFEKIIDSIK